MTVHYRINPSGYMGNTPLTTQQFIGAVQAAAQAWMSADPNVQLVYDGTTTQSPSNYDDVVGFNSAILNAAATDIPTSPTYYGFEIKVSSTVSWSWTPCSPPGQPCTTLTENSDDIQGPLTHEWGHVVGMGHVLAQQDEYLTMNPGVEGCTGCRLANTLGLGDVLGVRHIYPTSAPMPTLYNP